MSKKTYENPTMLRDGRILVYERADSKKKIKHLRILKPDGGYLFRTSKTSNLGEACRIAEDLYDEMRENVKRGIPSTTINYKELFERWLKLYRAELKPHRRDTIVQHMELYFFPYFGAMPISQINNATMEAYWQWRIDFWTKGDGVERLKLGKTKYFVETPSGSTLKSERTSFLQPLHWAQQQGFINVVPNSQPPIRARKPKDVARPAFTHEEWKTIDLHILAKIKKGFNKQPTAYGRRMFYNWVRLMFISGMRPNEAFSIRRKHISNFIKNDITYYRIHIPNETKTGRRTTIPLPHTMASIMADLDTFSRFKGEDDYIIHTWKGTKVRDYPAQWDRMIKDDLNIECDAFGDRRTPYSMRHTYITHQILFGGVSKDDIARNCGTSEDKINEHYDHVLNEQRAEALTGVNGAYLMKEEKEFSKALHSILLEID